jgi:hypothetical protein
LLFRGVEQTSVCRAKCQVTLSLEQTGVYDVGQQEQ